MEILNRKYLVETLKELLSDEYEADLIAHLDDTQLIKMIINAAFFYKHEYNN